MAFGYRYLLETEENGWTLVRFPGIPEALTEGESEDQARAHALDCLLAALEGYIKEGRPLPRTGAAHSGADRVVLPSLVTAKLDNDTTLRWDPSPGAGGYEILWRATGSPDWEHTENVGSRTEMTLPLSKDNVIFAVRAVDAEGHRSLAVVPEPQR